MKVTGIASKYAFPLYFRLPSITYREVVCVVEEMSGLGVLIFTIITLVWGFSSLHVAKSILVRHPYIRIPEKDSF